MVENFYNGQNPLDMPLYTFADASRHVNIPSSTVRTWSRGRKTAKNTYKPLIDAAGDEALPLSFHNLVELHVLRALSSLHNVSPVKIRRAISSAKYELGIERVLLNADLFTFGKEVFLEHLGEVVSLNRGNQIVLRGILKNYLQKVERDDNKIPIKLFPMIKALPQSKAVSIDPKVSFGRPVVAGTGISTKVIANRINAGESIKTISSDYDIDRTVIEGVLYYESAA